MNFILLFRISTRITRHATCLAPSFHVSNFTHFPWVHTTTFCCHWQRMPLNASNISECMHFIANAISNWWDCQFYFDVLWVRAFSAQLAIITHFRCVFILITAARCFLCGRNFVRKMWNIPCNWETTFLGIHMNSHQIRVDIFDSKWITIPATAIKFKCGYFKIIVLHQNPLFDFRLSTIGSIEIPTFRFFSFSVTWCGNWNPTGLFNIERRADVVFSCVDREPQIIYEKNKTKSFLLVCLVFRWFPLITVEKLFTKIFELTESRKVTSFAFSPHLSGYVKPEHMMFLSHSVTIYIHPFSCFHRGNHSTDN